MNKRPILILTGDYGSGHTQAARALERSLSSLYPDQPIQIVDFMAENHPVIHPIGKYIYTQSIQRFPQTYGYLFRKTRPCNGFSNSLKTLQRMGLGKFKELLDRLNPSAIVSVFPMAAGAVSYLKQAGFIHVPTITVITDYTDHSYWIYPSTDAYMVGSVEVAARLSRIGIDKDRIRITGIPVRTEFFEPIQQAEARMRLGLQANVPAAMVMGGGCGILTKSMGEVLAEAHASMNGNLQFVVVCGHNVKLRDELTALTNRYRIHAVITGFSNQIPELMAASDLIITKPGGLTSSEAMAAGLPMMIVNPIPGQEEDNADYLVESGAAVRVRHIHELPRQLADLLGDRKRMQRMRRMASRVSVPFSADIAAECISDYARLAEVTNRLSNPSESRMDMALV